MTTKPLKQTQTREILRSQINLNPYNPKRHSEKQIKQQKRNLRKVGYCGGILWNETTGNLIDGHRRIQAMDSYYKYDGSPSTDYRVKVEVINLNTKEEKEQLTYMALGNTKADLSLVAEYLPDIDINDIGIDDAYLQELALYTGVESVEIPIITLDDITTTYEDKKNAVKESKQRIKEQSRQQAQNDTAYITVSFSDYQTKAAFCEILGVSPDSYFVKGEEVLQLIDN